MLMSFCVSMIFARLAPTADLRDYNLYMPVLTAVGHLALFGQATGVTVLTFGAQYRGTNKSRLVVTSISTIIAASLVVVAGSLVHASFTAVSLPMAIGFALAASGLALRNFTISLFQITRNVRTLQLFALLAFFVIGGVLFLFPTFQTLLFANAFLVPLALLALIHHTRQRDDVIWPPDPYLARRLFIEGWPSVPGVFLAAIAMFGLRSVSEAHLSLADFNAAAFAMTIGISLLGTVLGAYFRTDTIAASEAIADDDNARVRSIIRRIHWTLLGVGALAVLVSETIGDLAVTTVFGERFAGYYWLFAFFPIISGLNFSSGVYALFLQFNRRMPLAIALGLVGPALSLALVYLVGPSLSLGAQCIAIAVANAVALLIMMGATAKLRMKDWSGYAFTGGSLVMALLLVIIHGGYA